MSRPDHAGTEAGCYLLHLYCRNGPHDYQDGTFPGEFTGRNRTEAKREARKAGWVRKGGVWMCRRCAR